MDRGLEAYFARVEASFCGRRGAPLLLSPLDFERVLEWYGAGVPPEAVEEGVARYFKRLEARKIPLRRAICISFAEGQILAAHRDVRAAAVGRAAGVADENPEASVARFLGSLMDSLGEFLADGERTAAHPVLTRAVAGAREQVEELLARSGEGHQALESSLAPLDAQIASLALLESPPEKALAWKQKALERLGSFAGGMDPSDLSGAAERLARREALRELGLPRLSLLFMEA